MSASLPEFTVNDLAGLAPRWDKLIAADLVREVENDASERVETIDEMRLFLAIKGYRQIFDLLTAETAGKTGTAALREWRWHLADTPKRGPACPPRLSDVL